MAWIAALAVALTAQSQTPATQQPGASVPAQHVPAPPPSAVSPRVLDIGVDKAGLSARARTELANAIDVHDYSAERAVLMREIAANPKPVELYLLLGRIAYLEHQPKDAAEALAKADLMRPLSETDRLTMATAYQLTARYDMAATEMAKLTKTAPKNAEYAYLLAGIDRLSKHDDTAVAEYRRAIALDPEMLKAYEELGQMLADRGATDDARKIFEEAERRNGLRTPRSELPPLDLGILLERSGDLAAAEKLFRESIGYNPRFADSRYQLGMVLQAQKKNGDAVKEFQQAVKLRPRFAQAWLALGRILEASGRTAEAVIALTKYQTLAAGGNQAAAKP